MESTIPGRTKCVYLEDDTPKALTNQINVFLQTHIVIDIKYIQNFKQYGAYVLYLTNDRLDIKEKEEGYELEEPNTYGLA